MSDDTHILMKPYRDQIDDLDDQIVDLLITREKIIRSVADFKSEKNIPAVLPDRVQEVISRCEARSKQAGMDGLYVSEIYRDIVSLSCVLEKKLMNEPDEDSS